MPVELVVPRVGESISEVEVGDWLVSVGELTRIDEPLVTLESEKATVDLPSPASGTLLQVLKRKGETAAVGEVIAIIGEAATDGAGATQPAPVEAAPPKKVAEPKPEWEKPADEPPAAEPRVMPAAQRVLAENGLSAAQVPATGPGGRVLKEDVLNYQAPPKPAPAPLVKSEPTTPAPVAADEEVVPMSFLRRKVAARMVEAQQTAALLTTFNEVDMGEVMALRAMHRDSFQKRYNVKLGFMSFFVKAVVDALRQVPQLNAEIRGSDIIYRNHYDIGVAISSGKGLVVPVLRRAEEMSFARVEQAIADLAVRARDNQLKPDELSGGTFTITNGGTFGSLLSTPIVNPPQSGILGMHAIQDRPVARDGQVVIRPMMYVALTYDHRLVDGREAITFLKRIADCVESPSRMLLEV